MVDLCGVRGYISAVKSSSIQGKVLITGASGFIGSRLRDRLLDAGLDVLAVRRPGSPEAKRGRSVAARYDDVDGLEAIVREERPDFVLHVAGVTKGVTYADFRRGNVMPTENLLAALGRVRQREGWQGPTRFVHVSSLAAFGPSSPGRPHRESDQRRPIEHYGESKLEAERVVESSEGIPWTIVRPSGVYGPGDGDYFQLFQSAARGWNVFFGNRDRWFSAVYVDDCVRAILDAAVSPAAVGKGYFLCDGAPTTWGDFQACIAEATPRRVRDLHLPEFLVELAAFGGELVTRIDGKPRLFNRQKAKMGAQPAWTCTHESARADFGYAPEVDQREGIRRAFEWYQRERWL